VQTDTLINVFTLLTLRSLLFISQTLIRPTETCPERNIRLLCSFFWVIPRRLNFICRRFGTICLSHLQWWCKVFLLTPPMKMEQIVPTHRHIKFRRRGITQKKEYGIQNRAKVLNQEHMFSFSLQPLLEAFVSLILFIQLHASAHTVPVRCVQLYSKLERIAATRYYKSMKSSFMRLLKISKNRLLASSCLAVCGLSIRPSVRPHATTRLPLDGFS
jgi:hypothetical protein